MHVRLTVVTDGQARLLLVPGPTPWDAVAKAAGLSPTERMWWAAPWPGAPTVPLTGTVVTGTPPLVDGATVQDRPPRARGDVTGPARIVVAAGPDVGRWCDLRPGTACTVGRDPVNHLELTDPMVSRRHVTVTTDRGGVTLADLGSTNGTFLDDRPVRTPRPWRPGTAARLGTTWLVLAEAPPTSGRWVLDAEGHRVVHPAGLPPPDLDEVAISTPAPEPPPPAPRMPLLGWALPLAVSLLLAWLLQMPYLALFGLMAPAMGLGGYVSERRSHRREITTAESRHVAAIARAQAAAQQALVREQGLRHARTPHPGQLVTDVGAGVSLWSRPAGAMILVRAGVGDVPSQVALDGRPLTAVSAPLEVDLTAGVRVTGPPTLARGLARSLLCQAAALYPPSALGFDIQAGRAGEAHWDWAAWLPHRPMPELPVVAVGEEGTPDGRGLLIGPAVCVPGHRGPGGVGPGGPGPGPGPDPGPGPATTLHVHTPNSVTVTSRGSEPRVGHPDLLPEPVARTIARTLTSVRPAVGSTVAQGRATASFRELHGDLGPAAIAGRWRRRPRSTSFVPGVTADGPLQLDLALDGPHVLVGGTTGSGKSELLRSMVVSLALANRPDELGFVLVDYKGGAAFGECARLPHTRAVVTDLDPHLGDRALTSLRAELGRRERVLAAAGARDLASYQDLTGQPPLPRLVLVIDEFRALAEELPSFLEGLVRVAALGRSLGVHLVLATQRPAGIVSADIRANVNLRIALRMRDESDSRDVIDGPEAAHLPEREPGRGLVRTGTEPARPLWVASVSHARGSTPSPRGVRWIDSPWEDRWGGGDDDAPEDPAFLASLADAAVRAATQLACRPVAPPWLPPLPDEVTVDAVPAHQAPPGMAPPHLRIGLLDLPSDQEQPALTWSPLVTGHLLVAGAPRSGRSTLARTVASALLASGTGVQFYGFDPAGALAPLSRLPQTGAWVGADETLRGARTVTVLTELLEQRRAALGAGGWTSMVEQHRSGDVPLPLVCLIIDDWTGFVGSYGEVDRGRVLDRMIQVLREGPAAGLVALITGDRTLLTSKVSSYAGQTWCLRMADPADALVAGLRPSQLPSRMPPGRLVRSEDGAVGQVATIGPSSEGADQLAALSAVVEGCLHTGPERVPAGPEARLGGPGPPLPRIERLPTHVALEELRRDQEDTILVGVGGDLGEPVGMDVMHGGLCLVAGPPGSGRTTVLATISAGARRRGMRVLETDRSGVVELPDGGCVLVDDVETIADTALEDRLIAWGNAVGTHRGLLVVATDVGRLATVYRGLAPFVARARTGLLLQPRGSADGAVLGAEVTVPDAMVPGRGLLVIRGRATRVQVAVPEPGGASPAGRG